MAKGIPVPDNDWTSLNVRIEDIDTILRKISGIAVTSNGFTIDEWDKLNKAAQATVKNDNSDPTPPTPPTPPGPPTPPTPPSPGTKPEIQSFAITPEYGAPLQLNPVTVTWWVSMAETIILVRTPVVGTPVEYDVTSRGGTFTIPNVAQTTTFLLRASNSSGETISNELIFTVTDDVPPTPPIPPPTPQPLSPPGNFTGTANVRVLIWEWDDVTNDDRLYYQFYASKTAAFDPDGAAPADMKYRISYGNQTNIVAGGAAEVWYGKVRQVARSGKSAFTAEVDLTST